MIKYLFIFIIYLCYANLGFSQNTKEYVIFDYFRQEWDSTVFIIGPIALFSSKDDISFKEPFEYTLMRQNDKGKLEIFLKDKLLYEYTLRDGVVNGMGYCYYPFLGNVAIQGEFKNNKLDGLVFLMERNGEVFEIMEFKKGEFKKQIFKQGTSSKRILKRFTKHIRNEYIDNNPLKGQKIYIM